ncbi:2EXR domain-containing protein [Aspergillus novofumigatus IBT 16806]|uniref:2EXR domain-containing protein n=1 Tax=Aspergillus novofumigatus (strain IBT 16806) TaxID=1392255 RepID=A0A2I1C5C3_ASPN1|nr:uncharacterized protein P174DRAFT_513355 [Aspergillus novofumigatus IBT 16806]PKX92858.1 hypothetical protein P174DRAFT_513355 [Aspergillus novofumigatus IBT 16806]
MAAFHLFPHLPFELRAQIWELTVEPRTVEVRVKKENGSWGKILHVTSSTPVPAGVELRYVWVNFEIDMISIGRTDFDTIEPTESLLIRRLTFEREINESFFHFQSYELRKLYPNVEEIHVICEDGLMAWQDAWEYAPWPCPKKKSEVH